VYLTQSKEANLFLKAKDIRLHGTKFGPLGFVHYTFSLATQICSVNYC